MVIKYDIRFEDEAIKTNLGKIINQTYRLLPVREEGGDWQKPLDTIIVELAGMSSLLKFSSKELFSILCKMEGIKILKDEIDFMLYRRTIFECLNLLNEVRKNVGA